MPLSWLDLCGLPIEKKLTEQFGFQMKVTINKNEAGSFRIPLHNRFKESDMTELAGALQIAA